MLGPGHLIKLSDEEIRKLRFEGSNMKLFLLSAFIFCLVIGFFALMIFNADMFIHLMAIGGAALAIFGLGLFSYTIALLILGDSK